MSVSIPCTQFVRPHAQKRYLLVDVCDEAGEKWEAELAPLGLRLTAEVIPGGGGLEPQVCVCIEHFDHGDYRLVMTPNLPEGPVISEVEKMILEFDKDDYHAWVESLTDDLD